MSDTAERQGLDKLDDAGRKLLFTEARSSNSWADVPVSDEELTSIWNLAKWPPTAANTQPLRVLYVRPGAGRERLVKLMSEGNQAKTLAAPAVAVLAIDTRFHEHIPTVFPMRPEMKDFYEANEAVREGGARLNSSMQAAYFILAVRAHGLAAGPMGGFDAAAIDEEFFPGGRYKTLLVVNIGHPGENAWFPRLPRLEHDDVITWA